jgi:N-acetyltransferase
VKRLFPPFDAKRFQTECAADARNLPNVALELMTAAHAPELMQAVEAGEIWHNQFTHVPQPTDVLAYIDAALNDALRGGARPFVIRWLRLPEPANISNLAGCTRFFQFAPLHKRVQIGGTWLAACARRTGVNRAVKWLLLREAFEVMGLQRVEFAVHPQNLQSRNAMLGIGATYEGELRKHIYFNGSARNSAMFSILDDEWPAIKQRLLS